MSQADVSVFDHPYLERDVCPGCGEPSAHARLVFASTPTAEELSFDRHSRFAAGYDTDRVFFSYFECPRCSLHFCRRFYTQDQLGHLYGHQQENMGEVPLEARRVAQESYARLLLKHTTGHGGFLEIGPDIGLFAKYCADNWQFDHFWLYEPNREVTDELKAAVAGHPNDVLYTMWPTEDVAAGSVSAMALIHVLDHLLDPVEYLERLWDKLEPGGTILTVTHNCASPLARLLGKRFPPHALQHPQLYSPKSITHVFEKAGFEVLEIASAVNYFPVMHLVRAAFAILGLPKPLPGAQGPVIPIKLGNIATVARKPQELDVRRRERANEDQAKAKLSGGVKRIAGIPLLAIELAVISVIVFFVLDEAVKAWLSMPSLLAVGRDGRLSVWLAQEGYRWNSLFSVTTINPFQGVGSMLLPINAWWIPGTWPILGNSPGPWHFILSEMVYAVEVLVAVSLLGRVLGLGLFVSVISAVLCAALLFPPYNFVFGLQGWVATAPIYAHTIALVSMIYSTLALIASPGANRGGATPASNVGLILLLIRFLYLLLLAAPFWNAGMLIGAAVGLGCIGLASPNSATFRWRLGAGVVLLIWGFGSGVFEFLYSSMQYSARFLPVSGAVKPLVNLSALTKFSWGTVAYQVSAIRASDVLRGLAPQAGFLYPLNIYIYGLSLVL